MTGEVRLPPGAMPWAEVRHRLDPDGGAVAVLRQPAPVAAQALARRHRHHGDRCGLLRLHGADRLADLPRPPTDMVRRFWEEITLPGYKPIVAEIRPGKPIDNVRVAAQFFRRKGVQSRPIQIHGIDIVTATPHVFAERTEAREADRVFRPGMVTMAEPNPITADGMFGIFLGHTFIVIEQGHEVVDDFPLELAVAE